MVEVTLVQKHSEYSEIVYRKRTYIIKTVDLIEENGRYFIYLKALDL